MGIVVGAALLSASCATAVSGTPEMAEPGPLTSETALGDLSTVDYCSLYDRDAVTSAVPGEDIDIWTGSPETNFSVCSARVDLGERPGFVTIGSPMDDSLYDTAPPDEENDYLRGTTLQLYRGPDFCERYLVFADGISMRVGVQLGGTEDGAGRAVRQSLCRVAEGAMDGVLAALTTGREIARLTFRDGSLGWTDPCGLLTRDEIAERLGTPFPAWPVVDGHTCEWEPEGGGTPRADVEFGVADLGHADATEVYTDTVAGRPSSVAEWGDTCTVATPQLPYSDANPLRWEIAYLNATAAAPEDSCALATDLAEAAWPRLPAPAG